MHTSEAPLFELPGSWTWVPFGEIALHNAGKTLDKGRNAGQPRDYITTSNLYWGRFELGDLKQMPIGDDEVERCTARKNDLLICEGGEAGRAAVWSFDREVCFQNHVHRARFFGDIDPYFGFRFFEWLNASGEIEHYRKGVGISNMSGKALASIPFSLPPLAEQLRIVAKVDELMALCDRLEAEQVDAASAHARLVETLLGTLTQSTNAADLAANWQRLAKHFDTLFTTEASIDALKQTVLQLAVMGKLVPQNPADEPASELLKRIATEKDRLSRVEGLRTTAEPHIEADEQYMTIPDSWRFQRLGNLAKFIDYRGKTPDKINSGVPLITAKNVRFGFISREPYEFVSEKEYTDWMTRGFPRLGDILFTTEAPLGNAAIVDISEKFALAQRVICFQFHEPQIANYLLLALMSKQVRHQIEGEATGMTATGIKASRLKEIPVPIPPIAEQHRIVAKVDELMTLCDHLKANLAKAQQHQSRLATTLIETALDAA